MEVGKPTKRKKSNTYGRSKMEADNKVKHKKSEKLIE